MIGEKLRQRRLDLKLSRVGAAEKIGISGRMLFLIESGENFSIKTLRLICDVYNMDFDVFVRENEAELPKD